MIGSFLFSITKRCLSNIHGIWYYLEMLVRLVFDMHLWIDLGTWSWWYKIVTWSWWHKIVIILQTWARSWQLTDTYAFPNSYIICKCLKNIYIFERIFCFSCQNCIIWCARVSCWEGEYRQSRGPLGSNLVSI